MNKYPIPIADAPNWTVQVAFGGGNYTLTSIDDTKKLYEHIPRTKQWFHVREVTDAVTGQRFQVVMRFIGEWWDGENLKPGTKLCYYVVKDGLVVDPYNPADSAPVYRLIDKKDDTKRDGILPCVYKENEYASATTKPVAKRSVNNYLRGNLTAAKAACAFDLETRDMAMDSNKIAAQLVAGAWSSKPTFEVPREYARTLTLSELVELTEQNKTKEAQSKNLQERKDELLRANLDKLAKQIELETKMTDLYSNHEALVLLARGDSMPSVPGFEAAPTAVKEALARKMKREQEAAAEVAAEQIVEVLRVTAADEVRRAKAVRELNAKIKEHKDEGAQRDRALAYAEETGNYLPLARIMRLIPMFGKDEETAKLSVIPKDWTTTPKASQ